jgi:hypothetical protein
VPEKITSKRKTAAGRKNQHLIQLLRTRIFGTGRATEIMYIMTVAPPARGELTIGNIYVVGTIAFSTAYTLPCIVVAVGCADKPIVLGGITQTNTP